MTTQPPRDALAVPLIEAAKNLLNACLDADAAEELDSRIDGSLLDAVAEAIDQAESAAQPSAQEQDQSLPTALELASLVYALRTAVRSDCGAGASREAYQAAIDAEEALLTAIDALKASLLPLPAEPADSLGNLTERCGYNSGACTRRGCVGGCQALACMQDASTLHDLCELLMHDCDETDANYMAAGRAKGSIATDYIRSVVLKACKPASEAPEPNEQTEGALPHEAALREALGELVRVLSKRPPDTVMKAERQLDDVAAALVRAKAVLSQGAKL